MKKVIKETFRSGDELRISIDDDNGYISITGTLTIVGNKNSYSRPATHEEILRVRPDLKPFVIAHGIILHSRREELERRAIYERNRDKISTAQLLLLTIK